MINKLNEDTLLKFKNLSPEEKEKRGILGRLYGKVADFTNGTRNGRRYSESLWENLLNSDLIKERFANGGIFGQLCHPDYEEVDIEKVACVMPEPPVKDKDGQLVAYVDILDTPCGRIAYQLAKYGYRLGISSRGTGDLITGPDGEEEVDPDTYQLNAFDLVEIPAVESARLSFVESLDKKRYNKTLKQALTESLNKETPENKKIMKEALDDLGINLDESSSQELDNYFSEWKAANPDIDLEKLIDEYNTETGITLDKVMYSEDEYNNFVDWVLRNYPNTTIYDINGDPHPLSEGTNCDINESFNPDMKIMETLDACIEELQSQGDEDRLGDFLQGVVDFCRNIAEEHDLLIENINNKDDTKEIGSDKQKDKEVVNDESDVELVAEFQESLIKIKKLEEDNLSLQEQLSVGNAKEVKMNEELARYKNAISSLSDSMKELKPYKSKVNELTESLNEKDKIISTNESRINSLVVARKKVQSELDSLKESKEDLISKNKSLTEELKNSVNKLEKVSKQLDNSNQVIEKYKRSYKTLKENYLETKAESYGLKKDEVVKRLGESYKIKDINQVCEELTQYKNNMKKLPFRLNENTKVTVKPSRNEYIKGNTIDFGDDVITDSLLQLADIK